MSKNGPLTTPFEDPSISTPSPTSGTLAGTTGGYDLPDAPPETPNMSDLGPLVTTVGGLQDAPSPGTVLEIPGKVASPAVPFPSFGKG